jgi:hypothetical protein
MVLLSLCILISGSDEKLQPARRYNTNPAISASLPSPISLGFSTHLFYFIFLPIFIAGLAYPVLSSTLHLLALIKFKRVMGRMQAKD